MRAPVAMKLAAQGTGTLSAITLCQPWASLVLVGAKKYEFRTWPPPRELQGRRIAIHAGARIPAKRDIVRLLALLRSDRWCEAGLVRDAAIAFLEGVLPKMGELPRTAVLCTAILGTPIRNAELAEQLDWPDLGAGEWGTSSNWGWPLTDIQPMPISHVRGYEGVWSLSPANASA